MFSAALLALVEKLLADARVRKLKIVTAESCTGGLIAGLLTEIAGSSDVVERGFVTYSNEAKEEMLGVPSALIRQHGAVSSQVALAMAEGALRNSLANVAVSVTGIAGPTGGTAEKPVGLVYIATRTRPDVTTPLEFTGTTVAECRFGDVGRNEVRLRTVETALRMLEPLMK
jgi:nicotinamide-nucleotide amidase